MDKHKCVQVFKAYGNTEEWIKVKHLKTGMEIAIADGDSIKWDKIISIRVHEPQHVYDLAIEGIHNFIANDIIAHNTYIKDTLNVVDGKVGIGTTNRHVGCNGTAWNNLY